MMHNPITGYQSLADEDYKMLAYVSSLKGLLKPFKSKGELELLESNARSVREMMEPLMQRLIQSARRYPVRQLPLIFAIGPAPPARTSCAGVTSRTTNPAPRHSAT
ncbi:hypothetical protein SEENIN0B_04829 [Salmonella enterica subsp. enterica serovar Infantis str. SARB27]|uniref:Uncharacterized protein n=1 Tax=Salmonella enterica subsp. enterica serovar Infantis str. SARB27 TaxID=596155 RepID=A0A6C8G146_SALIN|nr:hypothetical protein SEENIN0B_04829 [Salmonella enterica subsp. enterica serovar Infantis str. SARB27]